MLRIRYCANLTEGSGYAEAARNNVAALMAAGADVSLQLLRFEGRETMLDKGMERLLRPHIDRHNAHAIKIVHATPDWFPRQREPGVRNIGCTVWETDRLPPAWAAACNAMDEIWVPCDWNVGVFRESGVTVPIRKVPHAADLDRLSEPGEPLPVIGLPEAAYIFYSVFQWTPRKNPKGLIKAYLSEFTAADNVCLLLKTYLRMHGAEERRELERRVSEVKRDMGMDGESTPPVALLVADLGRDEILALHRLGNCMVLPHRAEGWGLPLMEAMAFGRPVIATAFGGNLEFMNDGNSFLIDYRPTPAFGMGSIGPYRGDQMWAEPDLSHLKQLMRAVYCDRRAAKEKGVAAGRALAAYSRGRVGQHMVELLASVP